MEQMEPNTKNTKYPVDFLGGHIDIKGPSNYQDKNGVTRQYDPVVDMSRIVDQYGRVSPRVFLNMVKAVYDNQECVTLLESLSKLK